MDVQPMPSDLVLESSGWLRRHERPTGERAPHKPLLALLAVARLIQNGSSETPFSVAKTALGRLEPGIEAALRAGPELARRAARRLVTGNFPEAARADILHLCVPRISSVALASRVALPAVWP
jgi:hypothetical protein